jgi:DNA-binding CsgD family transcriptional regulator
MRNALPIRSSPEVSRPAFPEEEVPGRDLAPGLIGAELGVGMGYARKNLVDQPPTEGAARPVLTDREKRVLELMSLGLTKKEIAVATQLSVHTVSFHLRRIYERLHVNTATGAVAKGIRQNLI